MSISKADLLQDIKQYTNDLAEYTYKLMLSDTGSNEIDVDLRRDTIFTRDILKNCVEKFYTEFVEDATQKETERVDKIARALKSKEPKIITQTP